MSKLKTLLASKRGETLVEVICATAIVLIALAALQGGVRFAHSALKKAETIREQTADFREAWKDGGITMKETETYIFCLTREDGTVSLEEVFRVEVGLGEKIIRGRGEDGGEQSISFAVFCPPEEGDD